jgi:hypothetical protein
MTEKPHFLVGLNTQQEFLIGEMWMLAWGASVQRAKLCRKGYDSSTAPTSKNDQRLSDHLLDYLLDEVIPEYAVGVEEEQHYKHIDDLIVRANSAGSRVLGELGYKYGVAQKLLNLFLKYLWCLGTIAEPPHCPVDRIIIGETRDKDRNWTEIVRRSEYQEIIEDIRRLANLKGRSIAWWELSTYGRR